VTCGLAAVAPAVAHVIPTPPFVEADTATSVSFATPNERAGHATTWLGLTAPAGVELSLSDRPTPQGWQVELASDRVRWSGGRIVGTDTVSFPVTVTARTRAGTVTFAAVQGYDDEEVVRWATTMTVLPAAAEAAPPQHFRRALVAGTIGLVVIGASLLALHRIRRGPLQNR
jgi:uncharacterized protein YcnI